MIMEEEENKRTECIVAQVCPLYQGGQVCLIEDTGTEKPCGQNELRPPRC